MVQSSIPDAQVQVEDLTGGGDHFQITVVSKSFQGKLLIEQHRLVQRALRSALDTGGLHAIQIKTSVPKSEAEGRFDDPDFKILS